MGLSRPLPTVFNPKHEVLPHPAPDDVGEPAAHGEAQRVPVGAAAGVEDIQLAVGALPCPPSDATRGCNEQQVRRLISSKRLD